MRNCSRWSVPRAPTTGRKFAHARMSFHRPPAEQDEVGRGPAISHAAGSGCSTDAVVELGVERFARPDHILADAWPPRAAPVSTPTRRLSRRQRGPAPRAVLPQKARWLRRTPAGWRLTWLPNAPAVDHFGVGRDLPAAGPDGRAEVDVPVHEELLVEQAEASASARRTSRQAPVTSRPVALPRHGLDPRHRLAVVLGEPDQPSLSPSLNGDSITRTVRPDPTR
jgi:hypothetical protein